jgi:hypothetical protein
MGNLMLIFRFDFEDSMLCFNADSTLGRSVGRSVGRPSVGRSVGRPSVGRPVGRNFKFTLTLT